MQACSRVYFHTQDRTLTNGCKIDGDFLHSSLVLQPSTSLYRKKQAGLVKITPPDDSLLATGVIITIPGLHYSNKLHAKRIRIKCVWNFLKQISFISKTNESFGLVARRAIVSCATVCPTLYSKAWIAHS